MDEKIEKGVGMSAKALAALLAMLDAFYRLALLVVNAILAPLRALGLIGGGGPTAAGIADAALAQAEAEDAGPAPAPALYDTDVPEPDMSLSVAASVWVRALELRGMVTPGKAAALPPEVEAWVMTLSPDELKAVTGMGAPTIANHLAAGPAGTGNLLPPYRGGVPAAVDVIEAGLALARNNRRQVRTERAIAYDPNEDTRSFAM